MVLAIVIVGFATLACIATIAIIQRVATIAINARIAVLGSDQSAMIVFDDADVVACIDWILTGILWGSGQVCSATSRCVRPPASLR